MSGDVLAGLSIGFVVGALFGVYLMAKVVREQASYTDHWYEDSRKWMKAYFAEVKKREGAST